MKTLAQIEPRTPIGSLPFQITAPGSYYLTTNLTGGQGISISASDVTLDLMGFVLAGATQATGGITISDGAQNVAVRDGTIRNWSVGVAATNAAECRFDDLRVSNNGAGLIAGASCAVNRCQFQSNTGIGVSLASDGTLNDCAARGNSIHGIVTGDRSRLTHCVSSYNLGSGYSCGGSCEFSDCAAISNGLNGIVAGANADLNKCLASANVQDGIAAGGESKVDDCRSRGNVGSGIRVGNGSTVSNCAALGNAGDGILATSQCTITGDQCNNNFNARDAAGIHVTGVDNCIKDNHVAANDRGVSVDAAGNLLIRNTAANSTINYFSSGAATLGPIFSGVPTDQVSNPWMNFDY